LDFVFSHLLFKLQKNPGKMTMTALDALPASWKITDIRRPHFKMVRLGWNRVRWFCLAELPEDESMEELLQLLLSRSPQGLVIRGCGRELADKLIQHNFEPLYVGREAVLDLSREHFRKKSLKELVRRGQKKGMVKEVPFSALAQARITELRRMSPHGKKPQLRHLFRMDFEPDDRCFVFETANNIWKAAITLSRSAHSKIQTELLVRHAAAPAGSMEALIDHIFFQLKKEGYRFWSLGEVPFIPPEKRRLPFKDRTVLWTGRLFNYAYNARGLFRFKNKFDPLWQDVYLCGYPAVSFYTLWGLFQKSNFSRLAFKTIPLLHLKSFNIRPTLAKTAQKP